MQIGIVKASDMARETRMDAQFHLAQQSAEAETAALRRRYSAEEARALVDAIALDDKRAIRVLMRGTRPFNQETAGIVSAEYPHLSLALIAREAEAAAIGAQKRIDAEREQIARLREISEAARS
jgi:hypothetical protein